MITIQENIDIKDLTTFNVPAICSYFTEIFTLNELNKALDFSKEKNIPILFLGGGSNILFVNTFKGLVIKLSLKGIEEILDEDKEHILVSAKAGENWDSFVQYCISKNYGGLENLSFIPGNVGTSPIQNIGAYGVEMKDSFYALKALNIQTRKIEIFTSELCKFGYRESYFKNEGKDKYVILEVTFRLTPQKHTITISYGAIKEELHKMNIQSPTLNDIREQVIRIRKKKLPDPAHFGNAGSFFKNPIIPYTKFQQLKEKYSDMPHYNLPNNFVKIPAGWLIEKSGWKGKQIGAVKVHENQALVIINLGDATGKEIFNISKAIIQEVKKNFNIQLEREVNIII